MIANPGPKTLTPVPRQPYLYEVDRRLAPLYALHNISIRFIISVFLSFKKKMSGKSKNTPHFYSFLIIPIHFYSFGNEALVKTCCFWVFLGAICIISVIVGRRFRKNVYAFVCFGSLLLRVVYFCCTAQWSGVHSAFQTQKPYLLLSFGGQKGKKQLSNMPILEMGAVKIPFPFIPFYSLFDLAESRMERKEILKRIDFYGLLIFSEMLFNPTLSSMTNVPKSEDYSYLRPSGLSSGFPIRHYPILNP